MCIIDTHAHLDADEFASNCDAVIARAVKAGVNRIITAGTSVEFSKKAIVKRKPITREDCFVISFLAMTI